MKTQGNHKSLYKRFLKTIFFALLLSIASFHLITWAGDKIIVYYFSISENIIKENSRTINEFYDYVRDNGIKSTDKHKITDWMNSEAVTNFYISKDSIITISSDDSQIEGEKVRKINKKNNEDTPKSYKIRFADGVGNVCIVKNYPYRSYDKMVISSLLISFGIFLLVLFMQLRKTLHRLKFLAQEIQILEQGDLSYPITITGNDEVSYIARKIENLRAALYQKEQQEKELIEQSNKMVTSMSHDLRTPMTSILLYSDLLMEHRFKSEDDMWKYIEKIQSKAMTMKNLSDRIFEYALSNSSTAPVLEHGPMEEVLIDSINDMVSTLEDKGFIVKNKIQFTNTEITYNETFIRRIFENISSNIEKYADPYSDIRLSSIRIDENIGIVVGNTVLETTKKPESTKIGLGNISQMMQNMNGYSEVSTSNNNFRIILAFSTMNNQNIHKDFKRT